MRERRETVWVVHFVLIRCIVPFVSFRMIEDAWISKWRRTCAIMHVHVGSIEARKAWLVLLCKTAYWLITNHIFLSWFPQFSPPCSFSNADFNANFGSFHSTGALSTLYSQKAKWALTVTLILGGGIDVTSSVHSHITPFWYIEHSEMITLTLLFFNLRSSLFLTLYRIWMSNDRSFRGLW
jgi:hypothetical protein